MPSLDIYQGGISLPDLELNFEAAVDIYRIEEGSIQKLITEVDGNCVNYSDGVLSGVIGEPYDNAFNKETIVYKSGYLHFVGYTGEWGNGLDITKINDNKFYCKGFNHSSITYVYERVNQLTEAVENPKEEILPGSIIISNDVQNGTCNLAILEKVRKSILQNYMPYIQRLYKKETSSVGTSTLCKLAHFLSIRSRL